MPDISIILKNVSEAVPAITLLVQALAAIAGFVFVSQGLMKFRAATKGEAQVGSAFMYLVAGVALLNLVLSVNVAFDLLYGGSGASVDRLVAYKPSEEMPAEGAMMMNVIVLLLQLYGLFFTVTGWMTVRKIADNRQGQEDTFRKAMFKIFGGAALLNIVLTVNTLAGWFGFGRVL